MIELERAIEEATGIRVQDFYVDRASFANFCRRYKDYRGLIDTGKYLEYFISGQILQFGYDEIYLDVAAQNCPFNSYVNATYGARAYRQDLYYLKRGVNGWDIGGDACRLPFQECDVSKMSLHNSFEHFEGDADSRFIREAGRVLRGGGLLCITPIELRLGYMEDHEHGWLDERGVKHLWGKGARFARHYDPETFKLRVLDQVEGIMTASIFRIGGVAKDIYDTHQYFALFEKQWK